MEGNRTRKIGAPLL